LEREEHELTVSKLIALADIYNIPAEQLLHSIHTESPQPILRQLSSPNATMLLTEGPLEKQAKYLVADALGIEQAPDETSLLAPDGGPSKAPFKRGIIGKARSYFRTYDSAGLHCSFRFSAPCHLFAERLDA
jgi:hypothetical protein